MKSILELNKTKIPAIRIDPDLNEYDTIILFPEKLEIANEMLKKSNFKEIIVKKSKT